MKIGKKIRYYREQKGLTQKELAKLINVTERTIGNYETDTRTPHLDLLGVIAKILEVKLEDLLKPIEEEFLKNIKEKADPYVTFYDRFYLFQYDKEKEVSVLKSEEEIKKYHHEDFVRVRIGKDLIHIPLYDVQRIMPLEGNKDDNIEIEDEKLIPIKEAVRSERNIAVIINTGKGDDERIAFPADIVVDVSPYIRNCKEENQYILETEYKQKETVYLLLTINSYKDDANQMNSPELKSFADHLDEFMNMRWWGFSPLIIKTKIKEIKEAYKQITDDIRKQHEIIAKEITKLKAVILDEANKMREGIFADDPEWRPYTYEETLEIIDRYAKEMMEKKYR